MIVALWLACAPRASDGNPITPPAPAEEQPPEPPAPTLPQEVPKESTMERIAIEGIVTAWKADAMRDHSEDSFAIYDAAEVRVTAPPEHAGRLLVFYVEQPSAPDLLLRENGAAVCFELRPDDLKPNRQLFSGAARSLRRC